MPSVLCHNSSAAIEYANLHNGAITLEPRFVLSDRIGSTRVVAKLDGTAVQRNDYDPYTFDSLPVIEVIDDEAEPDARTAGDTPDVRPFPYLLGGRELDSTLKCNALKRDSITLLP